MSETTQTPPKIVAIENENKYVLRLCFDSASLIGWTRTEIRQAYLHPKPYPRRREEIYENGHAEYTTNVKTPSDVKSEDIESEAITSKRDFDHHWEASAENDKVSKTRYTKTIGDETWCVDFFHDAENGTYFIMAEVEMPSGRLEPHTFPIELANSIICRVEKGDRSFSSRKLADPDYATRKLSELKPRILDVA